MMFAITHPRVSHPHHPDLVTGGGITEVARAAEGAGFHGIGYLKGEFAVVGVDHTERNELFDEALDVLSAW